MDARNLHSRVAQQDVQVSKFLLYLSCGTVSSFKFRENESIHDGSIFARDVRENSIHLSFQVHHMAAELASAHARITVLDNELRLKTKMIQTFA